MNFEKIREVVSFTEIMSINGINPSNSGKYTCPKCPVGKPPALSINHKENYFRCFRCKGIGGDVISLNQLLNNFPTYIDSAKDLGSRYNIGISEQDLTFYNREEAKYKVFEEFTANCHEDLLKDLKKIEHLTKDRGLTLEFIKEKRIGFSNIYKKNPTGIWKDTGLNNLRGGFVIPFCFHHKVKYITSYKPTSKPKYINVTGTKHILGEDSASNPLIITEGVFDQLLAEQKGFNVIAICGSSKKIKLNIFSEEIILAFDGDNAGSEYTNYFAPLLISKGHSVKIVKMPKETDLSDYFLKNNTLEKLELEDSIDYYCNRYKDSENMEDQKVIMKILSQLSGFKQTKTIEHCAKQIGVKSSDIKKEITANPISPDADTTTCPEYKEYITATGWDCTYDGMYFRNKKVTNRPIYIKDVGKLYNSPDEYTEIVYQDTKRRWQNRIIERGICMDATRLIKEANWLPINSNNKSIMVNFFDTFLNVNQGRFTDFTVTSGLGWHGKDFVLPNKAINASGDNQKIHYVGGDYKNIIKPCGDHEKWKTVVRKLFTAPYLKNLCAGARFCLYASATSIALRHLHLHPITINLYASESSVGKTTTMQLALSIYGDPEVNSGLADTWNTTSTGMIRSLTHLGDIPKGIDELSIRGGNSVVDLLYNIGAGTSKTKAINDSSNDISKKIPFYNIVFSTGERNLVEDTGRTGAKVRGWEILNPFGPKSINLEKYVNELLEVIKNNYGHSIEEFIPIYLKNKKDTESMEFFNRHRSEGMPGYTSRILRVINYIYNVGKLFSKEILGIESELVEKDCIEIAGKILGTLQDKHNDVLMTLERIKEWYEADRENFGEAEKKDDGSLDWANKKGTMQDNKPELNKGQTAKGFKMEDDLYILPKILNDWLKSIFGTERTVGEMKNKLQDNGFFEMRRANIDNKRARYCVIINLFKEIDLDEPLTDPF